MEPHITMPSGEPPGFRFPSLPVVTPDAPRLSEREKYGGLFYLGVAGLLVLAALIAWFAYGAWSHRKVWTNVYILHDEGRPEAERVAAALALSLDPRVNQRQRWDICLRKPLPDRARYLLAESLTGEAAMADPRAYALTVARSPGWPVWLRLLLARPLAYAAAQGEPIPAAPLVDLRDRADDPSIALWADFALAASTPRDREAETALVEAARGDRPDRALARILLDALNARGAERTRLLDDATRWVRENHPGAVRVWGDAGDGEKPAHPVPVPGAEVAS